jgi:ribosomal protein S21
VTLVIEVKRKKGESFESLLRRFNKRLQQSGKMYEARAIRYFSKSKSKNQERTDAVRRTKIRDEKEYLRKIGKLKEEPFERKKNYR